MKKRTAILLAAALVLSLSACSAKPEVSLPEPDYVTPTAAPEPTAAPTSEPTPEPTPADEYFVISMVGDCTLASSQRENVFETIIDGDMSRPFSGTRQYFEDDYLTIANLECSLSGEPLSGSSTFQFCGDAGNAEMLVLGGVDFVTLGNNHTMDFGQTGLDNTKSALEEYSVAYGAPGASCIYEADGGITVGLYAAPWLATQAQVTSAVSALAANPDVDLVIALMHWGDEGSYDVNSKQLEWGHAAVDAGADVVYGSHPHTLQPVEVYNGRYIFYSMGNWSFGGNTNPSDKDTAIARLEVTRDADGTCSVTDVRLIPCASSGVANGNNYQPVPYEEGGAEYERAISKLEGTFTGANLTIPYDYGYNEY